MLNGPTSRSRVKLIFCGLSHFYKIRAISKQKPRSSTVLLLSSNAMYWCPVPRWLVPVIGYLYSLPSKIVVADVHRNFTHWYTAHNLVSCVWNVMAHVQKPDFEFRLNGRVHLKRRVRQFSRLPVTEVCVSAVVMLDTPCSEVVWRILATHSIRQFPLHFPTRASPCVIRFQLESTKLK